MDFFVVFLIFAASLWFAWRGPVRPALSLFAVGMVLTVAFYLQHATDTLPLSF
jgi:RsiW-degrading membrane proteinase PrsW (M82 family)